MSNFKKFCSSVALLLMMVGGAQAESVRIWQNAAGEGFPSFYASMQKNGWADERGISVEGLRTVAYGYAEKNNLVEASDKQSYTKLFQQWNGLSGEFVTVEAFKAKGVGSGFWIASIEEMQKPVSVSITKSDVNTEVTKLQEEVKKLSSRVSASKSEESQLMGQIAKVSAEAETRDRDSRSFFSTGIKNVTSLFEKGIGDLKKELAGAQDEQVQAKVDHYAAEQKKVDDAQTLSIDAIGNTVAAVDVRVQTMEKAMKDSPVLAWGNNIFYAAGVLALLLIAAVAIALRRTTAVKQEVKEEVSKVNDRVSVVEEQVGGRVFVDSDTLAEIVELAKQQNEEGKGNFQRLLTVGNDAYTLRFIYTSPGKVKVEGIKDQTEPVKNDNLKSVILRAAGSGRIEGVSKPFSVVDDDTNVTTVAEEAVPAVTTFRRVKAA